MPIAEVLLVRGQSGSWVGVIDGRLVKGPRIGLWIRVRQGGAYRGVLGSVDDPIWIEIGEPVLDVTPSQRKGGAGLSHVQRANKRPNFGFTDYSPTIEMALAIDRMADRFSRRRQDGRLTLIDQGRVSDRYETVRLDGLDMVDPYDGSLVDWVYLAPSFELRRRPDELDLKRRAPRGLAARVTGGTPGRAMVQSSYRFGTHRLSLDGLIDLVPSGYSVDEDHSSGLPSYHANRKIDDRGRGVLLVYHGDLSDRFKVSAGVLHRAEAGYLGIFDTLAHGEWRQRNAALFSVLRRPAESAQTQAALHLNLGFWNHDDQRELAGPGLVLRDADADGNDEQFPSGVLFTHQQNLWNAKVGLEILQRFAAFRVGVGIDAMAAGMLSGSVDTNRGESGVALGGLRSHPFLGDRGRFIDGFGQTSLVAKFLEGPWRVQGHFGGVLAQRGERLWSGHLQVANQSPGRRLAVRVWSKPQLRLLDRHLAPEGYLAQGLSDSMPYGRALIESNEGLPAPYSEGVRFDTSVRTARSSGLWLYGLDLGVEEHAHSSDGVDRSGTTSPMADDGSVRSWWVGGRMDFAAFSGLRFHGSIWLGQSFAQAISGRGLDAPDLDQPWVTLDEAPTWRWRNTIAQVIDTRWMTGGGLQAMSPMSNSDRSALSTLHRFELPAQVRIDAWIRYQYRQFGITLRGDNMMSPYLLAPVPRPDRVPGLLPVSPRRVMLSVEWSPQGRAGRSSPF